MPRRHLHILSVIAAVSMLCYFTHRRTKDALVVADALQLIESQYLDPVDKRKLVIGSLAGMTDQLDPYSEFVSLDDYQRLQDTMNQEFAGIGIYVDKSDVTEPARVVTPLVGSPAREAGLKAEDRILEVDGESVATLKLEEVSRRLKGPVGSRVALTIGRADEKLELTVRRDTIEMESVVGHHRDPQDRWVYRLDDHPGIAYARLTTFGEKTPDELQRVIEGFGPEVTGFILDLRGNGGGLLDTAVQICDFFLSSGPVVSTEVRGGVREYEYFAESDTIVDANLPLVVLIDGDSASASEIVAAALQDRGRATIIGQRSYGKGTVQNVVPLEAGRSALKLTVARYLRPSGKNIHRREDASPSDDWGVSPKPVHTIPLSDADRYRLRSRWSLAAFPYGTAPKPPAIVGPPRPAGLSIAHEKSDETGGDQASVDADASKPIHGKALPTKGANTSGEPFEAFRDTQLEHAAEWLIQKRAAA